MAEDSVGDQVEQWLRERTAIQRISAPVQLGHVPGLGTILVVAVVALADSLSLVYIEEGNDTSSPLQDVPEMRDDLGNRFTWHGAGGSGAGLTGSQVVYFATFVGALPPEASSLSLYSVPVAAREAPAAAPSDAMIIPLA